MVLNQQGIWIPKGGGGSSFEYEIGQHVPSEGGVIFHRWLSTTAYGAPSAGTVQNYLVIDTDNLSGAPTVWSDPYANVGADSIFDGKANTDAMIAAGAGGGITAGTAAVLCNDSTSNGKNDWYLPAYTELQTFWQNRWAVEQGLILASAVPLANAYYWSSTQYNNSAQYAVNVFISLNASSPLLRGSIKDQTACYVRAARRFSLQP